MDTKQKLKHPPALWHVAYTYAFITFSFGMINSLLVLYLRRRLGFDSDMAYGLFAAFNSLAFTLPVISGYLAERFGYKALTRVGLLFCVVGGIFLSMGSRQSLYVGLAIFVFGLASVATTSYCLVDLAYQKDSRLRQSGFTLLYLIFNVGFFFSTATGGFIARYLGVRAAFATVAIASAIAFVLFLINSHWMHAAEGRSLKPSIRLNTSIRYLVLFLVSALVSTISVYLLKYVKIDDILLWVLVLLAIIGIIYLAMKQQDAMARLKLFAFLLLSILAITFWALYTLEPSLLTVFIASNVNRNLFGFNIPAASFYSLDAFNIIIFGLLLSVLWRKLAKKGKDLSLPSKFTLSLLSMGAGYWIFVLGIKMAGDVHTVNMFWIVCGYWFLTLGELLIAPIGLSMVGKLSPHGREGILMGVWQLFTGFSAIIAGYLADFATVPKQGALAVTNPIYAKVLFGIGLMAVIISIVSFCLIPLIKRLIYNNSVV